MASDTHSSSRPPAVERLPIERALLGAILIDGTALERVRGLVQESSFVLLPHRRIWRAMVALDDRGIVVDFVTIFSAFDTGDEFIRKVGVGDHSLTSYLAALINHTPTSLHVEHYARCLAGIGAPRGRARVEIE